MGKQKRSPNTYQKINTIFYRDENNIIMPYDEFVQPELNWLRNCKWDTSMKVDGTNMRIEVTPHLHNGSGSVFGAVAFGAGIDIKGKTDNANIPKNLEDFMWKTYISSDWSGKENIRNCTCDLAKKIFKALRLPETYITTRDHETGLNIQENVDMLLEKGYIKKIGEHTLNQKPFDDPDAIIVEDYAIDEENCTLPKMYTIYGEGYGKGIGKAGNHYSKTNVSFIGFDVKVTCRDGREVYLVTPQRDEIFDSIGIPKVIDMGPMTIDEAIEFVKKGFVDTLAEEKDFPAEGLVLKTPNGLLDRNGKRLCVKVKSCDWVKYFNKYGTYDKVEQKRNPKLNS